MKIIPIIALILSGIAVAVALTRTFPGPVSTEVAGGGVEKQVQQLQQRVRDLEAVRDSVQNPGVSAFQPEGAFLKELEAQVENLSTEQGKLAELRKSIDPFGVIQATEQRIQKARTTLMDVSRSPWERAKQAELLKQYGLFDDEAVDAMRDLFSAAEDANEKAAALVALRGHVTPAMRDEILMTLGAEVEGGKQSARLTYHGIEALEPLLPDSAVEGWLLEVAETNPEPKIAQRAATSLGAEIEWEALPPKGR
jgi:hypothetical protein